MATAFPFPPSPASGDDATLSSGAVLEYNGYGWGEASSVVLAFVLLEGLVDSFTGLFSSQVVGSWSGINYV